MAQATLSAQVSAAIKREVVKWAIFDEVPGTAEMLAKAVHRRVMATLRRHGVKNQ